MSKTFAQAPKPRPLTADAIAAFEQGGAGQDTQKRFPENVGKLETSNVEMQEPTSRLSTDIPESLHRRFKAACAKAGKKMGVEITDFIRRRATELEQENP